jgi:hypothetical protein
LFFHCRIAGAQLKNPKDKTPDWLFDISELRKTLG